MDRCDETVSLAWYCLDKARIARFIAEHLPDFLNGGIQAVIEFDKCVVGPKLFAQLFASLQLPRSLQKQRQQSQGLLLNMDLVSVFKEAA
jgi:hypothetical protein